MHAHACSVMSDSATPLTVACRAPLFMEFPGKITGVGCQFLLQEIFLTQELNPCLLHWQADSLLLNHLGSPTGHYTFVQTHIMYSPKNELKCELQTLGDDLSMQVHQL